MIYYDTETKTYKSSLLDIIPHGFGTKKQGDGTDRLVLERFLRTELMHYGTVVVPKQTHSTNVKIIGLDGASPVSTVTDTDALVTREKNLLLTVVTADCVPILYYDPSSQVIGISHGGWKGTLNNIASYVIAKMEDEGANRQNIHVAIGPAIGDCCYELYGERLKSFQEIFGNKVITEQNGKTFLNLMKANYVLLRQADIEPSHIDYIPFCTSCQSKQFYSYQRDKKLEGEMVHFIALP